MRMLIGIIVKGKNEKDAIDRAEDIVIKMIGEDCAFDYYSLENDDLEGFPRCAKILSEKGKEIIEYLFNHMYEDFMILLSDIRSALDEYTDTEIIEESDRKFTRHLMYQLGRYSGWPIALYEEDGMGIRTKREYDMYMKTVGKDHYIVLMNVHY